MSTGPGAPKPTGHSALRHPRQAVARGNLLSSNTLSRAPLGALKWVRPSKSRLKVMCSSVGIARTCRPLTCQAAVYHVVLPPKPENSLVWSFHRIHGLLSHFLKMFTTFFAPKECANVSPDGLQHSLGVTFKACRKKERTSVLPASGSPNLDLTGLKQGETR